MLRPHPFHPTPDDDCIPDCESDKMTTTATAALPGTPLDRPRTVASLTTIWTAPCGLAHWDSDAVQGCQPPNWNAYLPLGATSLGYYSPAICPSGFIPAYTRWDSVQGPDLLEGETARLCVQSGCTSANTLKFNAESVSGTFTDLRPYIQIRWQSSDLEKFQTPPLVVPGGPVPASSTPQTTTVLDGITLSISAANPSSFLSYAGAMSATSAKSGTSSGLATSTALSSGQTSHPPGSNATHSSQVDTTMTRSLVGTIPSSATSGSGGGGGLTPRTEGAIAGGIVAAVLFACVAALFLVSRYRARRKVRQRSGEEEEGRGVFELSAENTVAPEAAAAADKASPDVSGGVVDAKEVQATTTTTADEEEDDAANHLSQDQPVMDEEIACPSSEATTSVDLEAVNIALAAAQVTSSPSPPPPTTVEDEEGEKKSTAAPGYSALPIVSSSPELEPAALDGLRARQASLELERQRLLRLQEIEAEQARLWTQISEFGSRCHSRRPSSVI